MFLLAAFAIALAAGLAARPSWALSVSLCLGALLVFLDQSRLQPWFYQYLLMLGALAYYYSSPDKPTRAASLNACRLLIASIYFWSGVQKLNPHFVKAVLPWMIQPLVRIFPHLTQLLLRSGFAFPFIEIAIGLGLLNRRLRGLAVALALAMHCLLLAALGPFGRNANTVVWPWNIVMMAAVMILFWRTPGMHAREICIPPAPAPWRAAVLFIAMAPVLSLVDLWDHYPSWGMYSGNKDEAAIYISDGLFDSLPAEIQDHVYENKPGLNTLDIYEWSWDELNVPVYPEPRIYLDIAKAICQYSAGPSDLKISVKRRAVLLSDARPELDFDCPQRGRQ